MKNVIFFGILFCVIVSTSALAQNMQWDSVSKSMFKECAHQKCVLIDLKLHTISKEEEYFVGDNYYFTFNLKNLGGEPIESDYKITIKTNSDILVEETINVQLNEGEMKEYPDVGETRKIYIFIKEGSYQFTITPSEAMYFIKYPSQNGYQSSYGVYSFSFDVISKWQKEWADKTKEWQNAILNYSDKAYFLTQEINSLTKQITTINKQMLNLSEQMVNSSLVMEDLTDDIKIFTIINVFISVLILICTIFVIWISWKSSKVKI